MWFERIYRLNCSTIVWVSIGRDENFQLWPHDSLVAWHAFLRSKMTQDDTSHKTDIVNQITLLQVHPNNYQRNYQLKQNFLLSNGQQSFTKQFSNMEITFKINSFNKHLNPVSSSIIKIEQNLSTLRAAICINRCILQHFHYIYTSQA